MQKSVTFKSIISSFKSGFTLVEGNYNGKLLKTSIGGIDYVLALPSIITSDITITDLQDILTNKKLVYNNYSNLPTSYKDTGTNSTNGTLASNDSNVSSYIGPCPPSGNHTYKTTIYALNNTVALGKHTRKEFSLLNSSKILASALISGNLCGAMNNTDIVHNATITAPGITSFVPGTNLSRLTDNNTACCGNRINNSQIVLYLDNVEVSRKTITSSSNIIDINYTFDENNKYDKIELVFDNNTQNLREIEVFNYPEVCNL